MEASYFHTPGDILFLSVCLSVVNFNLRYNFWTIRDGDFIFGMRTPHIMSFQIKPRSMTLTLTFVLIGYAHSTTMYLGRFRHLHSCVSGWIPEQWTSAIHPEIPDRPIGGDPTQRCGPCGRVWLPWRHSAELSGAVWWTGLPGTLRLRQIFTAQWEGGEWTETLRAFFCLCSYKMYLEVMTNRKLEYLNIKYLHSHDIRLQWSLGKLWIIFSNERH